MNDVREAYWSDYFQQLFSESDEWLDYSNARVQNQTFGQAIEAIGPVYGRRCLDVGCGRGHLALALLGLGASEVIGIDIVAEEIHLLRKQFPEIRWEVGSPVDESFLRSLPELDVVTALEVLQYVDIRRAIPLLWDRLRSEGSLAIILPNRENEIVQRAVARFSSNYWPPTAAELAEVMNGLPKMACWGYRNMVFQSDQRLLPYMVTPWSTACIAPASANRFVVAARKT